MTNSSEPQAPDQKPKPRKKMTTTTLRQKKADGERVMMLTAYDATFARLVDEGGADIILIGDSLGMVIQGEDNTIPVTLEDMIYHCRAVRRATRYAHVVCDMPFMSYQGDRYEALKNAGRLMKEGGAESVKVEGGESIADTVELLVSAGIPVMGHLGLTPQSVHAMGGFKIQGREPDQARRIVADARALERAGVYAIVLEGVPVELARVITRSVSVPTIGIGAGVDCDGQVLVIYDLLGMNPDFKPKFVRRYAELGEVVLDAVARFKADVLDGSFPGEENTFHAKKALFVPQEVSPAPAEPALDELGGGLYGVPV